MRDEAVVLQDGMKLNILRSAITLLPMSNLNVLTEMTILVEKQYTKYLFLLVKNESTS